MLSNGGSFGLRVLRELRARGTPICAVILERPAGLRSRLIGQNRPKNLRKFAGRIWSWLYETGQTRFWRKAFAAEGFRIFETGSLNSRKMESDVALIQPDFIILGGIGILSQSILGLARHGVINCHPALLPWVRGTGVVGRSIQREVPVGCTCHYVDPGIDTGVIIERRLLPIASETTLAELEKAANELAAATLAEIVAEQVMRGIVPQGYQQDGRLPLSKWLSPEERESIDSNVRQGYARALFESWSKLCAPSGKYQLPAALGVAESPRA